MEIEIRDIFEVSLPPGRTIKISCSTPPFIGIISGTGKIKNLETNKEYSLEISPGSTPLIGKNNLITASLEKPLVFSVISCTIKT